MLQFGNMHPFFLFFKGLGSLPYARTPLDRRMALEKNNPTKNPNLKHADPKNQFHKCKSIKPGSLGKTRMY